VAEFAAVHLMAAIPNALMMERLEPDWSGKAEAVSPSLAALDGHITVPDSPGLGVELEEAFIEAHPSRRNVAIATGGWQDPDEAGATYVAMRRRRAELLSPKPGSESP
jgi:galactonate dehydratase